MFIDNSLDFHTNRVFSSHSWDCPLVREGNKALMNSAPTPIIQVPGAGQGFLLEHGGTAMRQEHRKWNKRGQSLLEYALVAAVISAIAVAMSTYVFRSVQATQQKIQDEFANE